MTDITDHYVEPTEDEILYELKIRNLDYNHNWWHVREDLRDRKNGNAPNGTDWGFFWKAY